MTKSKGGAAGRKPAAKGSSGQESDGGQRPATRRAKGVETVGTFIDQLRESRPNQPEEWRIRLVAKTPNSPAAQTVLAQLNEMRDANVTLQAVFTSPRAKSQLKDAIGKYAKVFGEDETLENVRVATFRAADQLPEQVTLGARAGWAGDSTGNDEGNEVVCKRQGPKSAKAAEVAFDLLWDVSSSPKSYMPKGKR